MYNYSIEEVFEQVLCQYDELVIIFGIHCCRITFRIAKQNHLLVGVYVM